ncbi:NADPH-dependent 2,4-dienoyl-CoA reductase, sulfur reductase [Gordonia malaquae]|uniref:Putative ferredoxin reductase n=1 Tax=Gordonia malaquae NBRC 108250 TaxID=1223542 RepID=M3VD75_GORML|nr:FAD-dependent oxidoreductase [Gordonia malaquae]GAC78214.1 putative ferredoxin reductase [Gordonia malaquae NBRC 108250]SED98116.1 NADPH-dependent 2,4-dienoyl-CoA reductase, sulfur reductase [Gordonia malaquae]
MNEPIVIVGAGLGGIRLAENLRNGGYDGDVVLLGQESHPPYDRPPLSKTVVTGDDERVDLKPSEFYADKNIDLRTGTRVVAVDPEAHTVTVVHDGETSAVSYGTLVLATGLVARRFPGTDADVRGIHVIRTIEDALALRADAASATRAAVIGAGFIGCEVAASLRKLELPVTLIEPAPTPLAVAVGATIGEMITRLHREADVDLRVGTGVDNLVVADGAVSGVELSDGSTVDADLVVVGIGGYPDLDYLDGSGLELAPREAGGGIACDGVGRAADDVYALGDAANWTDAHGDHKRVEHWNHVVDQAAIVASALLGHPITHQAVPYFWSDQYGLKIQMLGAPQNDDDVHVVDDDGRRFLAYYSRDGILTGVVGAGRVGKLMKTRPHLLTPTPIAALLGE